MTAVTLAQLEAFVWICRLGTFRAAAEELGVTQPTISLRIRELERALGATAFARRGGRAELTAQGKVMLAYAERGLETVDEMTDRVRSQSPLRGTLRLGSADVFAMTCLPAMLRALEASYPDLRVELTIVNSATLSKLLDAGELDLAFLTDPKVGGRVETVELATVEISWFGNASRALPAVLRPADLAGHTVVTTPAPSALNAATTRWFATAGASTPRVSTCNSLPIITELVASGVAVSVLPVSVVLPQLRTSAVRRYRAAPRFVPLRLCTAYQRRAKRADMDAVIALGRNTIRAIGCFD